MVFHSVRRRRSMRIKLPSLAFLTVFSITLILASVALSVRPVCAAPVFEDGFETGDLSKWTRIGGSPTVTSGDAHHGIYKAVLNATGEYAQARFTLAPIEHGFMRAYVMFKSFPTIGAQASILGLYNTESIVFMSEAKVVNVDGTIKWALRYFDNGVSYLVISEQQGPVLDTWYCVEVDAISNTTTNAESRIYINGKELTDVSQTGLNNADTINCAYIWLNVPVTHWYDCVVVDTAYIGPECTLTINVDGSGTVAKTPDQDPYPWGTNVTLTATPTAGWRFANWSGDASGTTNSLTVNITGDKTITATFTQDTYTLSVSTVGNGAVNLNDTGPYPDGDVIELTATPDAGWTFHSWSGDISGSTNPTTLLMDGDKTVTATFTQNVYTLTTTVIGSGSITRSSSGPYHYGETVELIAVPNTGWIFDHWSGDLSSSTNPATIQITENKAVTATFTALTPVGGHSIHIQTGDIVKPAAAYSVLICLLGAVLAALKRKNK